MEVTAFFIYNTCGSFHMYNTCGILCSQDVMELSSRLKCEVRMVRVPYPTFNHIDFLWAKDVYKLVYENVIYSLEKHELDRILKKTMKIFKKSLRIKL
jgi:hypothetical protein